MLQLTLRTGFVESWNCPLKAATAVLPVEQLFPCCIRTVKVLITLPWMKMKLIFHGSTLTHEKTQLFNFLRAACPQEEGVVVIYVFSIKR